jgi:purine-binding chemotaxis protein CheW
MTPTSPRQLATHGQAAATPAGLAGRVANETQIVVFELGDERYGLDIATVFEIIRHQPITAVPQAPAFVKGVINLRGRIIPVVDLRDRFGMMEGTRTKATRIVVCEAAGTRLGLIVDGVSEVLMIAAETVEATPEVAATHDAAYLRGIAKLGDRLIILLDLDGLLDETVVAALAAAA